MRLLGVALFTLTLSAIVMLMVLQRDRIEALLMLDQVHTRIERSVELVVRQDIERDSQALHNANLPMITSQNWVSLAGFPAFAKAEFEVPQHSNVAEAMLILDLTSILVAEATGRLRIGINGHRRAEIVLQPGTKRHEIKIGLLPADFAHNIVKITLNSVGQTPHATCAKQWTGAALIQVEPTSRIEAIFEAPITALNDRLIISGSPNRVAWPRDNTADIQSHILVFALTRTRQGRQFVLIDALNAAPRDVVLTWDDLFSEHPLPASRQPTSWPVALAEVGTNAQARHFENETQWKLNYRLRDMPERRLPARIDIGLRVQSADPNNSWLMSVLLNGALVHAETLSGGLISLQTNVQLPPNLHQNNNELVIQLRSASAREEVCTSGAPSVAQLLPTSMLRRGQQARPNPTDALDIMLDGRVGLHIAQRLPAFEAQMALDLLHDLTAQRETFFLTSPTADTPSVQIIRRADFADRIDPLVDPQLASARWLVWSAPSQVNQTDYSVLDLASADETGLARSRAAQFVLLISTANLEGIL